MEWCSVLVRCWCVTYVSWQSHANVCIQKSSACRVPYTRWVDETRQLEIEASSPDRWPVIHHPRSHGSTSIVKMILSFPQDREQAPNLISTPPTPLSLSLASVTEPISRNLQHLDLWRLSILHIWALSKLSVRVITWDLFHACRAQSFAAIWANRLFLEVVAHCADLNDVNVRVKRLRILVSYLCAVTMS